MKLRQHLISRIRLSSESRSSQSLIWLKVEADRCELDAASLESSLSLVYVHLLFDVFTRSSAKKSMPAGIEEGMGGGVDDGYSSTIVC